MKRLPLALLALFLAGCGNFYSVKIPYQLPENGNVIETKKALSGLYIIVKAEPAAQENALSSLIGSFSKGGGQEVNTYAFARSVARTFSKPGAKVAAYRVSRSKDDIDPYAKYLEPSGTLEIKISPLQLSSKKDERTTSYYDKKKQKQTSKSIVWVYKALFNADIKLYDANMKAVDKFSATFERAEERYDDQKGLDDWYEDNEAKLFGDAGAKLTARYIGRPVLRYRPIFKKKGDKEAEQAVDLAWREKWAEAEFIWEKRLKDANNWRDMLDLAVAAEVRKDYAGARTKYLKAREASAGDKEAKPVRWGEILGDLDIMLATAPVYGVPRKDWFSAPVAVLPFTDDTTSMDGPPMVRTMIYNALKAAGYNVMNMDETDRVLLSHGMTQGGQLGAADREEICKWLGAERLFFGHILEFGEVMAGVYNRRMIKGQMSMWDIGVKDYVWGAEPSVVKVKTPKSFVGGMFSQLAKGLWERMKNKPLAYEASLFSDQTIELLPNRPQ